MEIMGQFLSKEHPNASMVNANEFDGFPTIAVDNCMMMNCIIIQ